MIANPQLIHDVAHVCDVVRAELTSPSRHRYCPISGWGSNATNWEIVVVVVNVLWCYQNWSHVCFVQTWATNSWVLSEYQGRVVVVVLVVVFVAVWKTTVVASMLRPARRPWRCADRYRRRGVVEKRECEPRQPRACRWWIDAGRKKRKVDNIANRASSLQGCVGTRASREVTIQLLYSA